MRSAMVGTLTNMSRWKVNAPGDVFIVRLTAYLIACITIANALFIVCLACCCGVNPLLLITHRSTFSTVWWYMRFHIAFNWGFFTVVGTDLIEFAAKRHKNSCPINLLLLSWTQWFREGYLESHTLANWSTIWSADLLLTLTISTRFETGSMHVKALNINSLPSTWIFRGPMRSTTTSFYGATVHSKQVNGRVPLLAVSIEHSCEDKRILDIESTVVEK